MNALEQQHLNAYKKKTFGKKPNFEDIQSAGELLCREQVAATITLAKVDFDKKQEI